MALERVVLKRNGRRGGARGLTRRNGGRGAWRLAPARMRRHRAAVARSSGKERRVSRPGEKERKERMGPAHEGNSSFEFVF